jgi:membrane protease subunit HflC
LEAGNSTMILSPDSEFFDYLRSSSGLPAAKP